MMSHWRNSISGNSHWVRRRSSLEEEMLQLALEREVPQVFLKKVPDDTSDPDVHCFILSFPTRDPVNVLPEQLWDMERHCWCCTDLVKAPAVGRSLLECPVCERMLCNICWAGPVCERMLCPGPCLLCRLEAGEKPKGFRAERCMEIFEVSHVNDNDGSLSMYSFPFSLSRRHISDAAECG